MRKVGDWLARATGDEFRLYPEGASISKLDRKNIGLRAAAQYGRVVPIDIANCHPSILVAKGYTGSQGAKAYVCSREEHLKEAMGHYQIDRDTAKNLYQALTFGSGFTAWVEDEKRKVGRRRLDAHHQRPRDTKWRCASTFRRSRPRIQHNSMS